VDAAAFVRLADLESGIAEHVDHRLVVVEHLGLETNEAAAGGDAGQAFEQQRADAAPLVVVVYEKGDLGLSEHAHRHVVAKSNDALVS
jgi:hypothetical protein